MTKYHLSTELSISFIFFRGREKKRKDNSIVVQMGTVWDLLQKVFKVAYWISSNIAISILNISLLLPL